jgi:hypothetical protein
MWGFMFPVQAPPQPSDGPRVVDLVIADLLKIQEHREAKYGFPLRARNGRNGLQDAYEEAIDLAMYLKQCLIEQGLDG